MRRLGAMTTIQVPTEDEVADFSRPVRRIAFRIAPDTFDCVVDLPVMNLIDFAEMADKITDTPLSQELKDLFEAMFQLILTDESAQLFLARLHDKQNPIGMEPVQQLVPWVMEKYGMRPTEPSDSSSDGQPSPGPGLNSTANVAPTVSTSESFLSIGS